MKNIMQGDAYKIPVTITSRGENLDVNLVDSIEMAVGSLIKAYPGELEYADEKWFFPVSQEETFALPAFQQPVQVRVKFNTGEVIGAKIGSLFVESSHSKEVL